MADDEQIGRGGLRDQDDAGVPHFHDQLGLGSFREYVHNLADKLAAEASTLLAI